MDVSCEFGACSDGGMSFGQSPNGSDTGSVQFPSLVPVAYYNGSSFNVGMAPPARPDPRKVCVNKFESSLDGRFYNFWSLAAPFIGPDRMGSAKEDTVGVASKYVAVKWFQYLGYEDFVGLVKTVAGKGLLPLSIAATGGQITGHLGCQFVTE